MEIVEGYNKVADFHMHHVLTNLCFSRCPIQTDKPDFFTTALVDQQAAHDIQIRAPAHVPCCLVPLPRLSKPRATMVGIQDMSVLEDELVGEGAHMRDEL